VRRIVGGAALGCGLWVAGWVASPANEHDWREKVDASVLETSVAGNAEFIVVVSDRADLSAARQVQGRVSRIDHVVRRLRKTAADAQRPVLQKLETHGAEVRPYWIANVVWARGNRKAIEAVARSPRVVRVDANPVVPLSPPTERDPAPSPQARSIEWNVTQVNADQVWALGHTGTGIVVGVHDTGFFWDHPALRPQYRGWNGSTASHDYNWHDAVHDGLPPSSCPADSPAPCDDNLFFPHGTHVMGIALGDDDGSNQIGVSPNAELIGCRSIDLQGGTPARYIECFQWLLAPTDLQGSNPDPSKAPHVINTSWVCTPGEGCNLDTLQAVMDAVRAAGIVVVGAAGNSGPDCGTIDLSPAIYASTFTVGSTDATDTIAGSSSRGPVTADGSGRLKPEVSAPGVDIRSAVGIIDILGGGGTIFDYLATSGTSMAAPHVAGAVALLLDAQPDLIGRVDEIETLIEMSAVPLTTAQGCGGDAPNAVPNNVYGHGRLDVLELVSGDADADGVVNTADCAPVDAQSWAEPGAVIDLTLDGAATTTLGWSTPASPGGSAVEYDLLRSASPADFSGATCLESRITTPGSSDGATPAGALFYLVRVRNACGENAGEAWNGARTLAACP